MAETASGPNDFSVPDLMSDVVLVVEGRQLHVNKTVLALASPVFQKMFFGDFKEKKLDEIPLPGKKYSEIKEFLLCIYPSSVKEIAEDNLDSLTALADEYSVLALKERCRVFAINHLKIHGKTMDKGKLLHLLVIADKYGFDDVQNECLNAIIYNEYGDTKGLQAIPEFAELSEQAQINFFKRRLLLVEGLVRSVLVNSLTPPGQLIDDFEMIMTSKCVKQSHRQSRHECRGCKGTCCGRCRTLATEAMEDLSHAIKNLAPAFKESK